MPLISHSKSLYSSVTRLDLAKFFLRGLSVSSKETKSASLKNGQNTKDEETKARETQQALALSLKDFGSLLSTTTDEATQPIESGPIFKDPTKFANLSLLHQGQVLKELQNEYDKNWNKMDNASKKLGYYIAYGNWGVREDFDNWKSSDAPYDLPFKVPSVLKTVRPLPNTIIEIIKPPVNLAETPIRKEQFNMKAVDGVTKFFIYLTIFISMLAIYRDKAIGEEGKPTEITIEDPHEKERIRRIQNELIASLEFNDLTPNSRRWYYLWLK
ncbi:uncharacterized protein PRCAT00002654001 [Priceomyces carsonii]|uniref:uncharacterized protein n=1 Tax=Priceomyces carsonii TaxID=28549 RepID=UPI002ED85735|nr:unnamed protein product [Priceomyces carsonii]